MSTTSLWVFGYASLLWKPGFHFTASRQGTIRGYSRRFWQGNTRHRGTPSKPGRVATLIEEKDGEVWGVAYEIQDPRALPYLNLREVKLGGYTTAFSTFYPDNGDNPFPALLYLAAKDSDHWMGPAPDAVIAENIISSCGAAGHNVEYLIRLADYIRQHAPSVHDPHLFTLEEIVRSMVLERGLSLVDLMGPEPPEVVPTPFEIVETRIVPETVQFVGSLATDKLRCLSI